VLVSVSNMATSSASVHFSVKVLSCARRLLSKIVLCPLSVSFDGMLRGIAEEDCRMDISAFQLLKVEISDRQNGEGTEVDPTSPVSLCVEFSSKFVVFHVSQAHSSLVRC
jgi:hypothetical protein